MKFTQFVRDYLANNKDSGLTYREAMKDDGVRCAYKQYEADLCKKGIVRAPEKRPEPKKRYNKKTECGDNVINQTINTPQYSPSQPQSFPSPPPQVGYQGPPPKAPRGSYAPSVIDQMAASPYYQQNPLIFEEAKKNVLAAMEQAKAQPRRPAVRPPVRVDADIDDDSTVVSELPEGEYAMRPPLPRRPARVQMDDDYSTVVSSQPDDESVAATYPGSDAVSVIQGPELAENEDDDGGFGPGYYDDGGFGPGTLAVPEVQDFPESYQAEAKEILEDDRQVKEALDDMLDTLTEKQLNDLKKRYEADYKPKGIRFAPTAMTSGVSRTTDRPALESDLLEAPSQASALADDIKYTWDPIYGVIPKETKDLWDSTVRTPGANRRNVPPPRYTVAPSETKEEKDSVEPIKWIKEIVDPATNAPLAIKQKELSIEEPVYAAPAEERRSAKRKVYPIPTELVKEGRRDLENLITDSERRQQGQQVQNVVLDIVENEIRSRWETAFDEFKDEIGDLLSAIVDESVDEVTKEEVSKKLSEEIDNLVPTIEAKDIAESVAEDILGGVDKIIDIQQANEERDADLAKKHEKKWKKIRKSTDEYNTKIIERVSIGNDLRRLVNILENPEEYRKWMTDPQMRQDLETAIAWRQVSADLEQEIVDGILDEISKSLAKANNRYVKKIEDKIKEKQKKRKPIGRVRGRVQSLPTKAVRREGKLQRKQDTYTYPFDTMDIEGSGIGNKKERMKELLSAIIDLV
jgi:hypothetical protein